MEELLYRYNPWWEGDFSLSGIVSRQSIIESLLRHLKTKDVVFLTGLRRIGKTTILKLFIKELIDAKAVDPKYIFYISLDDYLLTKKSVLEIVEEYRKLKRIRFREKIFLFLDEIAYKGDFEIQLKNLFDSQNVKIYASSSSASVIKTRKPYLTGRGSIFEVLPLDFNEYMKFKNIALSKSDEHLLAGYFEDYLFTGGVPEYVLRGDIEYLKELVDDIIYKDISVFYSIKKPQILKDFFLLLMERAGKAVSINKIANILKISPDTARRYLEMFADTFLIYLVPRCGKTNERILSPKKIYAADIGIRNIFTGFRDKGSLFENYIYLKIKNQKPCYIYENGIEIDFMTEDKALIEVKYMNEMTLKQKSLFEKIKARKKIVIKGPRDIQSLG
ncbi:MAG: ATP-binding protein [Nitrospirae bacterium]|nr:ATP-binding protein [Nitrospirota bacterium]